MIPAKVEITSLHLSKTVLVSFRTVESGSEVEDDILIFCDGFWHPEMIDFCRYLDMLDLLALEPRTS